MNIAIIGCGYIGSAAAALWTQRGEHVTATTRNPSRLEELAKISQKNLVIRGNNHEELIALVMQNEAILVSIAADSAEHYESAYLDTAKLFRQVALELNMPRTLIYTGSTSVYGDHQGLWVDEATQIKPSNLSAKILAETESTYLSLEELGWSPCVFRFAEIYGPGREISKRVKQLEGHIVPGSGSHYTNMVHQQDCALAIDYALQHRLEGVFNLADDSHPTRKQMYDEVSKKFHLASVRWDPSHSGMHSGNKRVSNHKIKAAGFTFAFPERTLI